MTVSRISVRPGWVEMKGVSVFQRESVIFEYLYLYLLNQRTCERDFNRMGPNGYLNLHFDISSPLVHGILDS